MLLCINALHVLISLMLPTLRSKLLCPFYKWENRGREFNNIVINKIINLTKLMSSRARFWTRAVCPKALSPHHHTQLPLSNSKPAFTSLYSIFQTSLSPHEYELMRISCHSNSIHALWHNTGRQLNYIIFNLETGTILKVKSFLATGYLLYLIDIQFMQLGFWSKQTQMPHFLGHYSSCSFLLLICSVLWRVSLPSGVDAGWAAS